MGIISNIHSPFNFYKYECHFDLNILAPLTLLEKIQ